MQLVVLACLVAVVAPWWETTALTLVGHGRSTSRPRNRIFTFSRHFGVHWPYVEVAHGPVSDGSIGALSVVDRS